MTSKVTLFGKKIAVAAAVILCFSATVASASTYYVDSVAGSDSNAGSSTAPWKTVTKVNGMSFYPGDQILFKCGGSWDTLLKPSSGTSGSPVSYGAYGTGNKPLIRGFYASSKSYITAQNIAFRNGSTDSPATILTSHHIVLRNCDIIADPSNSTWAALYMLLNSHHNEISGCNIAHLTTSRQSDAVNLRRNANYNIIRNNNIGAATHYSLSLEGFDSTYPTYSCNYNLIQGNTIYNPQGATMGLQSGSSNNVVEKNTVYGGKSTSYDANLPRTFKAVSQNNIIRYNILRDNTTSTSSGLGMEVYAYNTDPPNVAIGNRVYNNTITNITKYPIVIATNGDSGATAYNNYFKNNAVYNNLDTYQLWIQKNSVIYDNFFSNNLFFKTGTSAIMNVQGKYGTVADIQAADPTHFKSNLQTAPMLDSTYKPQIGSPCIDAGDFLTKVTSAGGSGSVITVADDGYFSDGMGLTAGDTIMVGNYTATITAINRSTHQITLNQSVTFKTGDAVSMPYKGSKPDIGAIEYQQVVAQPLNLQFTN
ncbi:polysaccharide lyase domain-containing protein [Geomonas anaerohicana]|uniref:Right-handed parallel beta-helix repeat-containing protein n=1 Tax=Geomonas anaerohicana TaxID=2798583 RepID=A0ABS0YH09_9BACT|nr:right-handed parallel beta-helix repeat-containing protein [Geomonas anaerohicana]MBJ6751616.1 right-handed parallel beta-helix repeat-containing protein [Geomonas anaerohicana]